MAEFKVHSLESAPEASKPILEQVQKKYGMLPNLFGVFAESPAALKAYSGMSELLEKETAFNPVEQQVVLLAVSFENKCHYCMAAHSAVAAMAGAPNDVVESLRSGKPIRDPKLEALRQFASAVAQQRGHLAEEDVQTFLDAGYTQRHVLDVLMGVAMKTLSNYTNHIAHTPLDKAFEAQAWKAEAVGV